MALIGVAGVAVAAVLADLAGSDTTRGFTRRAFYVIVLLEMGLTLQTVSSVLQPVASVVP